MIDFNEEVFEENLRAATSRIQYDFSHSSYSSETSFTKFLEYSYCLRIDNVIKHASEILDKEMDQILHSDSKHLDKTSAKVFETELNEEDSENSLDFTYSRSNFDY